jgi:TRAP transporter TAXI family solute receptor
MGKRKSRAISLGLILMLVSVFIVASCTQPAPAPTPAPTPTPAPAPTPAFKMPDPVATAALELGSSGYVIAAAIADTMRQETDVTMRVVPVGTDVGRVTSLVAGRVHALFQGSGAYYAQEGIFGFDAIELGPTPMRLIVAGMPTASMVSCSAEDANIMTWADLKGKRLAYVEGYPAVNQHSEATLAFAGLTWDDVERVEFTGFGAQGRGVIDDLVDAATCSTASSYVYELADSARGLRWVPYPHDDEAGWTRMREVLPIYVKSFATTGAKLSKETPYESGTYPNPMFLTIDNAHPDMVYELTKMMVELYPMYSKAPAPAIDQFDPERIILDYVIPYHEGAIRYYKETGRWTDEHQKNNDSIIKRQQVLQAAWDKAIADATEQKISAKNFPEFWKDARVNALKAAGF